MSYLAHWVALLDSRGVAIEQALQDTGISPEMVEDPDARVPLDVLIRVVVRGIQQADDPSIGLELGLSLKPTSHSWFGMAMMTARTLGEACELGVRYMSVVAPWRIALFNEGERGVMQFEEVFNLGPARAVVREVMLGAVVRLGEFLRGHTFAHPDIEFLADFDEEPHHARFRDQLPRVRFGCAKMQARFPAVWLEQPLMFAEPVAQRRALAALDDELRRLGAHDDWVDRIRAVLAHRGNGFPDLEAMAATLETSSRTLRRHLQQEGTRYHELRDEARRAQAITLLEQTTLSLDAIAFELGYANAAGLCRAAQRWLGEPPEAYRRRHTRASSPDLLRYV
jgi:AraC-like DNA-binding protein